MKKAEIQFFLDSGDWKDDFDYLQSFCGSHHQLEMFVYEAESPAGTLSCGIRMPDTTQVTEHNGQVFVQLPDGFIFSLSGTRSDLPVAVKPAEFDQLNLLSAKWQFFNEWEKKKAREFFGKRP